MLKRIRSFIQRGIRGWSDEDTWDFFRYLADVIAGGTKYLLKNPHSYPASLTEKEWERF